MTFYSVYHFLLLSMLVLAPITFVALYLIDAGYGILKNEKWGMSINNKLGWFIMEAPIFLLMLLLWFLSERKFDVVPFAIFLLFQIHYFHRAFIFPFILKGKSSIPILIVLMGFIFNGINSILQGGWLFYFSPQNYYSASWLSSPQFIIGTILFFAGMIINIHSDQVIRSLRKPGDTNHYLPKAGMFRYVTSANYFGEIVEWLGFAILSWSFPAWVFVIWTAANLIPRSHSTHLFYRKKFYEEMKDKKLKRIIPFIY